MSGQAELIAALLSSSDDDTRRMYERLVSYKRLTRDCGHIDGWAQIQGALGRGAISLWQCMSCGLVAPEPECNRLLMRPAAPEPSEAIGTALAGWHSPGGWP